MDNAPAAVTLTVTANDNTGIQEEIEIYTNLQPRLGELDLGDLIGPPVAPVLPGESFEVPVWINMGDDSLGGVEIAVAYSSSLLELVDSYPGADWPSFFESSGREFSGFVYFGGLLEDPASGLLHVATLTFRAFDTGVAGIRAEISTLLDRSNPPQSLPITMDSPAANIGVVIGTNIQIQNRPNLDVPIEQYLSPSVESTPQCTGGKEVGDVNGDCVFNLADVLFLYKNEDLLMGPCTGDNTDFNIDGVCNEKDLNFLLRANFKLVSFVQNVMVTPTNVTDCFLTIRAEMIGRGNQPVDPTRTTLLFGLFNRDQDFQAAVDATTGVQDIGQLVEFFGDIQASTNGGFFLASYNDINDTYKVILDTHIGTNNVSLILVQAHTDAYGLLNENRVEVMIGPDSIPPQFPESLSSYIEHPAGLNISFSAPLGFSAILTFDQVLSSPDCINTGVPQFFPEVTKVEVYENLTIGSLIATVFANDSDAGPNAEVRYSLNAASQEILDTFRINETTGEVFLLSTLDREITEAYRIIIRAVDQGVVTTNLGGLGELSITVLDVNDNNPEFEEDVYTPASIREDIDHQSGIVVATVKANDEDLGENSVITYSLLFPYEFDINSTSGEISVASQLDYETTMQYNLTVVAEDGGTPSLNGTAIVIITVEPVNDNTPDCGSDLLALVTEDEFMGTVVLEVSASDADRGSDHAELTFTLPTNNVFALSQTGETTADIFTINEDFNRATTSYYNLMVFVSDAGNLSCIINITVVVAEPSRFNFQVDDTRAGFLTGPVASRRSRDGFDQKVSLFRNSFESGVVTGSLADVDSSAEFSRSRQSVEEVELIVRESNIWFDNPVITAMALVRDTSFNTLVSETTVIQLGATPTNTSIQTVTSDNCEIEQRLCSLSVGIPLEWFELYDSIDINVIVDGDPLATNTVVGLNPIPQDDIPMDNLIVKVPSYTLYPTDNVTIWVGSAVNAAVIAFTLELRTTSSITLSSIVDNTQWTCSESFSANATFVCLRVSNEPTEPSAIGTESFFGIRGTFSSESPQVIYAETVSLVFESGLTISTPRPAYAFDRNGLNAGGMAQVYIEPTRVIGFFASAERPELVNTAALGLSPIPIPVSTYLVHNSPQPPYTNGNISGGDFNCAITSNQIVTLDPGCTISVDSSNSRGGDEVINVTYIPGSLTYVIPVRVWFPSELRLSISDATLNLVSGWNTSSCNDNEYQSAIVTVFADFTTGDATTSDIDITDRLASADLIMSSDPTVVSIDGRMISGVSPLRANISVMGRPDTIVEVAVTDEVVEAHSLLPTVFTTLSLSVDPNEYTPASDITATALITQNFNSSVSYGYAAATVYFTDGNRYDISTDNGLVLATSDSSVASIESDGTINPISSGTADITLSWVPQPSCSSVALISAVTSIEVTVPVGVPERIEIVLSSLVVSGETNGITLATIPTRSIVTVLLYYSNGSTEDVTSQVGYSTSSLTLTNDTGLDYIIVAAATNSSILTGEIVANYSTLTDSKTVTIVHVLSLDASLQPYPNPDNVPGANDITLRQVNAGYWQQARITTEVVLSDSSRQAIDATYASALNIPSDGIITPSSLEAGRSYSITGIAGGLQSDDVVVTIEDAVETISVIDLELQNIDQTTKRVIVDLTFADGTRIEDIFTDSRNLKNLLMFELSPMDVAMINLTTGILSITDNYLDEVSLVASTANLSVVSNIIVFAANLLPGLGEVDLGQETDIPQPPVNVGDEFIIDIRVKIDNNDISALDILVEYDPDILQVVSSEVLLNGFPATRINSPPGEVELVAVGFSQSNGPTPTVAQVTFRSIGEGETTISSSLLTLVDEARTTIGTSSMESKTGNLSVRVGGSTIGRREAIAATERVPRAAINVHGDANGDNVFNVVDALCVYQYLIRGDCVNDSTLEAADANGDETITVADVLLLVRASAGLLPFLTEYTITEVSRSDNCLLEFTATIAPTTIDSNFTFVYFILSHPDNASLLSVTQAYNGNRSSAPDNTSVIFEAYPTSTSGEYYLSLFTPVDFQVEDIGLSIAIFTTQNNYVTSTERYVTFINSGGSSNTIPEVTQVTLMSSRVPGAEITGVSIGEPGGFYPRATFTNDLRSDYCEFRNSTILVNVSESQGTNETFDTISAVEDGFPQGGEVYTLITDLAGVFDLSPTGELQLITELDYENTTNYTLEVSVTIPTITYMVGEATIFIEVVDENDNRPIFVNDTYIIEIAENAPEGESLITLEAFDLDDGTNGQFDFSVDPTDDPNMQFNIANISATQGNLVIAMALDREEEALYTLTVYATDRGTPKQIGNATVIVTILDINDNSPTFDQPQYSVDVSEDFNNSTVPLNIQIIARDTDLEENGTVTLALEATNEPFQIDQNGLIYVTGPLDRENISSYGLIVTASDNGAVQMSNSTTVTITILDVNDNRPMFADGILTMLTIEEDTLMNTLITTITATDEDAGDNGIVTYSILEGTGPFTIDEMSGEITLSGEIMIGPDYTLTIVASDQGTPQLSNNVTLTVTIVEGQVVSFNIGTSGFLVGGLPVRTSSIDREYSQNIGYIFGEAIGTPAVVTGGINTATQGEFDSTEYPNTGDTAVTLKAGVLQDDVKHSSRMVTVFAQVFDSRDTIAEPTVVQVRVVPAPALAALGRVSHIDTFCTTAVDLGYCIAQATLPNEWFARDSTDSNTHTIGVWVKIASQPESNPGQLFGTLTVEHSPAFEEDIVSIQDPLALITPSHAIYPGVEFVVGVQIVSPIGQLLYDSVEADITFTHGTLDRIIFDDSSWDCSK